VIVYLQNVKSVNPLKHVQIVHGKNVVAIMRLKMADNLEQYIVIGAIVRDTASITAMEFTENSVAFLIPGFVAASLFDAIFWVGLLIMFPAGFLAAYPVMSWAMKRTM